MGVEGAGCVFSEATFGRRMKGESKNSASQYIKLILMVNNICVVKSLSRKVDSCSASQEIRPLSWNPKVYIVLTKTRHELCPEPHGSSLQIHMLFI
jgi:hypothetical protein